MAEANTTTRRHLLKAGSALAFLGIGARAAIAAPASDMNALLHHFAEMKRLLEKNMPEGSVIVGIWCMERGGEWRVGAGADTGEKQVNFWTDASKTEIRFT